MTALWWDRIEVFLQLSYIAFYGTLGIQGLWEAYFSGGIRQVGQALRNQGTTPVVFALALAAFPAALTGMFLFAADIQPAILDGVWKGVFGFLVLVFVVERRQHYRQFLRKPDPRLPEEDVEHAAAFYILAISAIELPCLWMNFQVAFPT